MNDPVLSSLRTYWERLRAGRIAPYRAEIDPRQFEGALETMFIVERVAPGNLRIRLAGMRICEMMGMEARGLEAGHLVEAADRLRFERLLAVAMSEPAVVELRLLVEARAPRTRAAMLLMPLRNDFGEVNRVLGCVSAPAEIQAPPLALRIEEATISPIETAPAGAEARQPLPGFAEEPATFAAPAAPQLRAIEGNPDAPARPRSGAHGLRIVDGK